MDVPEMTSFVEAADYLIELYKRLWRGGVVRDLGEAIASYEREKRQALSPPSAGMREAVEAFVERWDNGDRADTDYVASLMKAALATSKEG